MSRGANIAIGVALIAIGLVVTMVSYSSAASGGRYVVAWGAVLVGAIRLIRALSTPQTAVVTDSESFEQAVGRSGPSRGEQVTGRRCVECDQKILSVMDGVMCSKCSRPVHNDCEEAHVRDAHGKRRSAQTRRRARHERFNASNPPSNTP